MEKKNVGKPKIVLPKELINEIIHLFIKDKKVSGLISYMDVLRFSIELENNGTLESLRLKYKDKIVNEEKIKQNLELREHFWRKGDGRKAIDEANKVLLFQIPGGTENIEQVVDTSDAIEKFFLGKSADKYKLLGALQINEQKLKRYIKENRNLMEKISKLERKNEELLSRLSKSESKCNSYEQVMFTWLDASMSSESSLVNLMTTGKSRHPIVKLFFEKIFSDDPLMGYRAFDEFRSNRSNPETPSKVINIEQRRSVLDDIRI
ncbi:hypothetical protein [Paenibacillus sp. LjRoot56]|uniref:hypothetical protein n=1 Tax=Paenibacillus sp. LjRoot56 TaxID=3342333 RepID=UPI003ECF0840